MAVFDGIDQAQVQSMATARLQAHRDALAECEKMNAWLAGVSVTELSDLGFSGPAAQALKTAFADAGAEWQLYGRGDPDTDGTLPAGYTLPYTFGASQRIVLGPA